MKKKGLSTQPYKGSRDFYPDDMRIRNYIFETWKVVCESYGYQEYDGPFLESFDIYAAKSGDEIVNEQLYSFEDKAGRKLAIRPEMTPTVARMVAQKYKELLRPIRWFSIPNLWRYEKPQRGRLREHFQLNLDIFGVDGVGADFEVMSVAIDIMRQFGANEKMFEIRVGNRRFIEDVFKELRIPIDKTNALIKAIDKMDKVPQNVFTSVLTDDVKLNSAQIEKLLSFLNNSQDMLNTLGGKSKGAQEVNALLKYASMTSLDKYIKYDPKIMRGFDYYTGNVFEQFDLNPNNTRSMYGGGRYDDLVDIFVGEKISGVGWGMGDVTLKMFLEDWKLLPNLAGNVDYLVTLWPDDPEDSFLALSFKIADDLRKLGLEVQNWLEPNTKLNKQLKYADKYGIQYVLIVGQEELAANTITIKNLRTQQQETKSFEAFLNELK